MDLEFVWDKISIACDGMAGRSIAHDISFFFYVVLDIHRYPLNFIVYYYL